MKALHLSAPLFFLFVLSATTALSKGGGHEHDSLVYDGARPELLPNPGRSECILKVVRVNFSAYGTVRTVNLSEVCGETDTIETWWKRRLEVNDEVRAGDSISTGPDGLLTLQLNDGREITLGENTSIMVNSDYCHATDSWVGLILHHGKVAVSSADGSKPAMMNMSTTSMRIHTKGTIFTVELGLPGGDIVKVFRGSVEVTPVTDALQQEVAEMGQQMASLTDEFQKKKITQKEFTRRAVILSTAIQKLTEGIGKVVTLNAGYECSVDRSGRATTPKRFDGEGRWFQK